MCGLAGVVGEEKHMEQVLSHMCEAQKHRGSDIKKCWCASFVDAQVGLMHTCMRSLDKQHTPPQPFEDVDTGLVLMIDGEIFNGDEVRAQLENYYSFSTHTLCELMAKAYDRWGDNCFERFEGYFAVVIYNRWSEELILARDRFGVKPLYYATRRGTLFFASEIKSLFAGGIRPLLSSQRWASYFVYTTYGNPYETFWEGVHQLPAGYLLHYNGYSLDERRWYEFETRVEGWRGESPEYLADYFKEQLLRSVGYSLTGNMSKGLSLNGGLESALFVSLMKSVGLPRSLKSYLYYRGKLHQSGVLWGAEMLAETPLPMEQVRITKPMLLKELEYLSQWQEEPIDGVNMLTYSAFFRVMRKRRLSVLSGGWGLTYLLGSDALPGDRSLTLIPSDVLSPEFSQIARKPQYQHLFESENENLRYFDWHYERIPHLLRTMDKMGMYYGVQVRNAFLNHNLIEIAFALESYHSERLRQAWFSNEVVAPLLPQKIRLAPKRVEESRREFPAELKHWADDAVHDLRYGQVAAWFDYPRLKQAWEHPKQGGPFSDPVKMWKLLSLCLQLKSLS